MNTIPPDPDIEMLAAFGNWAIGIVGGLILYSLWELAHLIRKRIRASRITETERRANRERL